MPEIPELHERLGDGVVELREIAEWDIPEILIAHQDDPGLHSALGEASPPSGAELGREVELAGERRRAGERLALTVLDPGENYCRGRVVVTELDWVQSVAWLTIWVAPQRRGRGFASHALELVSEWLFDTVGLQRLELVIQPTNQAMARAAAAAGFSAGADPAGSAQAQVFVRERVGR